VSGSFGVPLPYFALLQIDADGGLGERDVRARPSFLAVRKRVTDQLGVLWSGVGRLTITGPRNHPLGAVPTEVAGDCPGVLAAPVKTRADHPVVQGEETLLRI